jgi:hypothetical protein
MEADNRLLKLREKLDDLIEIYDGLSDDDRTKMLAEIIGLEDELDAITKD